MERYAGVLLYAIPFFIVLLIIERIAAGIRGASVINGMDTLSSLSSGVTNVIKDVLGLTFVIISYSWLEARISLFDIPDGWWLYVLAFIGIDFAGYWNHRLSHQVNYFWNVHIIHHSSEEFNLACALRQSISTIFGTFVIFLIPTAILGVPGEVITIVAPLHLFAQYWYHTRLIGKMGILEKIIVTPSHHRVHHAINKEYLDKNMAQIFIIWDKLFGTFQEELDDVPPVYGVKRPGNTWNPILINFQHLWQLIKDAWRTKSWLDRLRIWFMPTGWRPEDVKAQYPVDVIEDVYAYDKYAPQVSNASKVWFWAQGVVTFLMLLYMFARFGEIGAPGVFIFGGYIYLAVFNYTTQMDKSPFAIYTALVHSIAGIAILTITEDWFLIADISPMFNYLIGFYFILSFVVTAYLQRRELDASLAAQQMAGAASK